MSNANETLITSEVLKDVNAYLELEICDYS